MKKNRLGILFFIFGVVCIVISIFALMMGEQSFGTFLPLVGGILFVTYAFFRPRLLKLTASGWLRKVRITVSCLCVTGIIFAGVILTFILTGADSVLNTPPHAIVVLGAGLKEDVPSHTLANRLDAALSYWAENQELVIVVSGGQGPFEKTTEAEAMAKYLLQRSAALGLALNESQIILEDKATSTFENFKYTKEILDSFFQGEAYNITFVTSDFHIFRSKLLAQRVGMPHNALSAPTPNSVMLNVYVREILAVVKTFVFDRI